MGKFYVLSMAAACIHITGNAQIQKGRVLLGGQLSFGNSINKFANPGQQDQKSSSGNFRISGGKAVKENTVIGIDAGYSFSNYDDIYNGGTYSTSKNNGFTAGIFYRQYRKLVGAFFFLGEAEAGYLGSKEVTTFTSANPKVTRKVAGGQILLTPGISYAVNKRLRAEISLPGIVQADYRVTKFTNASPAKQNSFSINTNLDQSVFNALAIGFRFVL
jgi:hypothetical protein